MARWRIPFTAFLVCGTLLLFSCSPATPQVRRAAIDLRAWDFPKLGPVKLDGEWRFWWHQDVRSQTPLPAPEGRWAAVPGYWNAYDGSPFAPEGTATYHLHLSLPPTGGPWSLSLPEVAAAWTLTANGEVIGTCGTASSSPSEYWAHVQSRVVSLPAGQPEVELFLYIANFSDRAGGFRESILVGPSAVLERGRQIAEFTSSVFVGGLFIMAMFNLLIFFLQKQQTSNLWLALFTLCVAARTLFTGTRACADLWPTLSFETTAQVAYLCIFGAITTFIFYIKSLFPDWWNSRVFVSFLLYTALFATLLFFLPVKIFTLAVSSFYYLPLVFVILVLLGVSWWATHKKHEDGPAIFYGMMFLVAGAFNDILYQFVSLPQGYVLDQFLFIFLLFNSFLLARQLSRDFDVSQRQTGELRQLDKMKDEFLARVTHELRTPLHGMAGILDAFRMGDFGALTGRQSYHLGLIESSSKRLLNMVSNILDFSHLKKHQLVTDTMPVHLHQTVDFLLPAYFPLLKPGVALVNRIDEQCPAVLGDEMKLEQMISHLVQNAVQHTHRGTITLESEVKDQQVVITIRDTGVGISQEKMDRLFTPFHQLSEVDTRETGGLGLGLAISRQLAQLMGGRLELESKEGFGTAAILWLPLCPPAKLQYFQAKRLDRTNQVKSAHPEEALPKHLERSSEANAVVMIVDDEPVNLLVLRTFLTRIGYKLVEATNGPEALQLLSEHVIDLVILDIMMPGMSGYEVCVKMRERFSAARLPVLLLTAKNQVEDLLQGYECGASDFLTKPFQRQELQARMELHLRVSKAARSGLVVANKE